MYLPLEIVYDIALTFWCVEWKHFIFHIKFKSLQRMEVNGSYYTVLHYKFIHTGFFSELLFQHNLYRL